MQAAWQGQWQSEADTHAFGLALATRATPGDCVALVGDMGAGKTTLTRAMAEALGVDIREQFGSPTYTYANEYEGALGAMVHLDLYRVPDESTALSLGLPDSMRRADALVVIEWADKLVPLVPAHAMWLRVTPAWGQPSVRTWSAKGDHAVGERLFATQGTPA